jgi:hypothetical protein
LFGTGRVFLGNLSHLGQGGTGRDGEELVRYRPELGFAVLALADGIFDEVGGARLRC